MRAPSHRALCAGTLNETTHRRHSLSRCRKTQHQSTSANRHHRLGKRRTLSQRLCSTGTEPLSLGVCFVSRPPRRGPVRPLRQEAAGGPGQKSHRACPLLLLRHHPRALWGGSSAPSPPPERHAPQDSRGLGERGTTTQEGAFTSSSWSSSAGWPEVCTAPRTIKARSGRWECRSEERTHRAGCGR